MNVYTKIKEERPPIDLLYHMVLLDACSVLIYDEALLIDQVKYTQFLIKRELREYKVNAYSKIKQDIPPIDLLHYMVLLIAC